MSYSLHNHQRGYSLSVGNAFHFLCLSPYAIRHWELGGMGPPESRCGHKVIAICEAIPVIGLLASSVDFLAGKCFKQTTLVEEISPSSTLNERRISVVDSRIVTRIGTEMEYKVFAADAFAHHQHAETFHMRAIDYDTSLRKGLKNLKKAFLEAHPKTGVAPLKTIPTLEEMRKKQKYEQFTIYTYCHSVLGGRRSMEDTWICKELEFNKVPYGSLYAVFDGHGGAAVSNLLKKQFSKTFRRYLKTENYNPSRSLELALHEIHQEALKNKFTSGSTACICYCEYETNFLYTACLGDSQACLYRIISDTYTAIPVSCVRDFGSKKDEARALEGFKNFWINDESLRVHLEQWKKETGKARRFIIPKQQEGVSLNVSRAIGDAEFVISNKPAVIIQKPKITVQKICRGDILAIGSDGIMDLVNYIDFIGVLNLNEKTAEVGQTLESTARAIFKKVEEIPTQYGHDNQTLILVRFE